jgi:hypothetical protein
LPALFTLLCLQCRKTIVVVVYDGPDGRALVALPESHGGLATPQTPPGVAYYLDQAQRSQSIGALSAAVAMYRAALDHLLHEQGYTNGMLGQKIRELAEDGNPPKWYADLDDEYLRVIKDLGNAAIHPNDGDVGQQRAFDAALLLAVRELFVELLDDIYEAPKRKANRLASLREAARGFKHPAKPALDSDAGPGDQAAASGG